MLQEEVSIFTGRARGGGRGSPRSHGDSICGMVRLLVFLASGFWLLSVLVVASAPTRPAPVVVTIADGIYLFLVFLLQALEYVFEKAVQQF